MSQKRGKTFSVKTIVLLCIAIIGIAIASVFMFSEILSKNITISFETNGGSSIENIEIKKGEAIPKLNTPFKKGYLFISWCYDEFLLSVFNEGDVLNKNTTLYANYTMNPAVEFGSEYLDGCAKDITFKVKSQAELTDNNLTEFLTFLDTYSTGTALQVKKEGDFYTLFSKNGFPEGCEFGILLNPRKNTYFTEANGIDVSNSGINAYNFSIKKENIFDVTLSEGIIFVDNNKTLALVYDSGFVTKGKEYDIGKSIITIYQLDFVESLKEGTIINLSQDHLSIGKYYKVLSVEYPVTYTGNSGTMKIRVVSPELSEIYSKYELYQKGNVETIVMEESIEDLSKKVADSVINSVGFAMYLDSVIYGMKNSPSVQSLVNDLSDAEQAEFSQLSAASFIFSTIKDPPVTFKLVSDKDGLVLDITIDTGNNISFKVGSAKIDLQIIVKEHVIVTPEGHTKVLSEEYTYSNKGVYVTNTSQITFKAGIKYTGPSDPKAENSTTIGIDIGKEIEKACADKSLEEYLIAMGYGNLFAEDLDYVEIASVPLGFITFTFSGVESIKIELNLKVSCGCSAGITTELIYTSITHIGVTNGHTNFKYDSNGDLILPTEITPLDEPERYKVPIASKFSYDILIKGQIGIRVGVEVKVTFSIVGLNDVFAVGIYAEVGVYGELTGYVRFQGSTYKSDEVTHNESSIKGGIYFETGIYLSCGFTWNCFGYNGSWPFLDLKFPLYSIGTDNLPVDFVDTDQTILMHTKKYNLAQAIAGQPSALALSWVNIISVKSSISADKDLDNYSIFMTKMVFERDALGNLVQTRETTKNYNNVSINNGIIEIADNAPMRFDFTVYVMYNNGTRLFDGQSIVKQINITYVDASIENPNAQHTVTFYGINSKVIEQTSYYEGQIPVQPDLFNWTRASSEYTILYDSDKGPWLDSANGNVKAIASLGNTDESYYLSYKNKTFDISFYGYVYNQSTKQYVWGLIDSVAAEIGKIPTAPDVPMTDVYKFYEWDKELTAPLVDSYCPRYDAIYADRYIKYMIDFVCGDELVSRQWYIKGDTVKIPDMSEWVSKDGKWKFSKWYIKDIGPVTNSYVYQAELVRANFTVFKSGVWTISDGVSSIYIGLYTYDGTKYFIVPDIICDKPAGANRETLYWQSTEKFEGEYIKLYPGDRSLFYNLEFEPIFEYTVHLLITGDNKQIFKGKAGDVITEDMITLSKNQNGLEFVDWGIKLPYTFGSLYDNKGLPDLEVVFDVNFKAVVSSFTVTLNAKGGKFNDGSVTAKTSGLDGQAIIFNQIPVKPRSGNVGYEFIGWGTRADDITVLDSLGNYGADFTCYAIYKEVLYYQVTYAAGNGVFKDGSSNKVFEFKKDTLLPAMTEIPSRTADNYYTYSFSGWQGASQGSPVLGNLLLTALYSSTDVIYSATFNTGDGHFADGSTTKTITGKYNEYISIEDPIAQDGYTFTKWSPSTLIFTRNNTYTAQYQTLVQLKVTFDASLVRVYDSTSNKVLEVDPILSTITYTNGQSRSSYTGGFNEILNLSTDTFATSYNLVVLKDDIWITISGATDGGEMYFMADDGSSEMDAKLSVYDWGSAIQTEIISNLSGSTSQAVRYTPGTIRFGLATYWLNENGVIAPSPDGYEISFSPYIIIN